MQTLEINYKAVFETLPGKNVLLLPDAPVFTILAISDSYLMGTRERREQAEGKSVFTLFSSDVYPKLNEVIALVRHSLETVLEHKTAHAFEIPLFAQDPTKNGRPRLVRHTNKPIMAGDEVAYILHCTSNVASPPVPDGLSGAGVIDFAKVLNQAPVAMAILRGRNLVVEMANAPMLTLWGRGREVIGSPLVRALPELGSQEYPALLRRVFESGEAYVGRETPATFVQDGTSNKRFFNFVCTPVQEYGVTTGVIAVASDVTGLVESKKKLEESENRYRDLIANATVGTAVYVGREMRIHLANASMLKLWKRDHSIIGKTFREALPDLASERYLDLLHETYSTGRTHQEDESPVDRVIDGKLETLYYNFAFKALRDSRGEIYGILNMAIDVTESVKARMRIKEAEERWRIALDSAELGTWDYFPQSQAFLCSPRMREMYGLPEEAEPTFEDLLVIVDERDRQRVTDEIRKCLYRPATAGYRVEYRIKRGADQHTRWLRTQGRAFFNEAGEVYRLTGTVFDITERKEVEEALEERVVQRTRELLEANRDLARSNHELEQYAYVASHDLQEPLRKILIYTDLLKEDAARKRSSDEVRLDKIMASAMRMSHLIQDLLNFSRLMKAEDLFCDVDLGAVVRDVVDDFELLIEESGANIHIGNLPHIEGSAQQINQMFYNLLNNALKFRKENVAPQIGITARLMDRRELRAHPELMRSQRYYDIQFSDNGIGFDPKYNGQIFEIFKRLHSRSRYEGTGIGLALCRKIARNHRGEILADSRQGDGASFHILLPEKQQRVSRRVRRTTNT